MSKIAVTPNASGSGTFTLTTPGTDSDQTITLPNLSGVLQVGGSSIQSIVDSGNSTSITIDTSENVSTSGNLTVGGNLSVSGTTIDVSGQVRGVDRYYFKRASDSYSLSALARWDGTNGSPLTGTAGVNTVVGSEEASSSVILAPSNVEKMRVTSTGVDVTGALDVNSANENVVATFTSTDTEAQINLVDTTGSAQIRSRNDLRFFTNGGSTRAMDIDASGNVGIGTTSPTSNYGTNLNVHSSATDGAALHLTDGTTGNANTDGFHLISTGGVAYVWNRESTDMVFATSNTERMRIDASGNVGIGTTSPARDLQIGDATQAQAALSIQAASTGKSDIFLGDGTGTAEYDGLIRYDHGSNFMAFWASSQERMRIDGSGRVTTPNNPAFLAYGSESYVERSNPMEYSSTNYNVGNHYSTTTYLFTAPVAGRYLFTAGALKTANDGDGGIIIVQNSTNKARAYHNGGPTRQRTVSVVLSLSANDTVKVIPEGDPTYYLGGGYGYFSGVLIG